MMGGKSGGDGGSGAMLQYGDKALELQKKIYEENKGFIKPYYEAGGAGLNELMKRMGLGSGTGSNKTEAQFRAELAPTYQTQKQMSYSDLPVMPDFRKGGNFSLSTDQGQRSFEDWSKAYNSAIAGGGAPISRKDLLKLPVSEQRKYTAGVGGYRLMPQYASQAQKVTTPDSAASLDAAVKRAMDAQTASNTAAQSDSNYGSLLKSFGMDQYKADPGYQFRLAEGNKALERALASKGQFASMNPAAAKALQDFGQQSASQEYGAAYDRYNMDQGNIFNRLAAITGIGQTSTGQLTGQGNQLANSQTDILTGQGNALAAAAQQKQANKGSMFNSILGLGGQLGSAFLMSDISLKENIKHIGYENGHKIYEFNYKTDPDIRFIGVMAQDVEKTHPEAVTEIEGFKAVNYDAIGVKMREVH